MKKTLLFLLASVALLSCTEKLPQNKDVPGSKENPLVITTAEELANLHETLPADSTTYVVLGADIDMKSVKNFVPLNCVEPYDKEIYFDGKGYTISNLTSKHASYASLFGVLYGECVNLKIDNAYIESGRPCGVLARTVGAEGKKGKVDNVTITNSKVANDGDRAGGVCGVAYDAIIKNVSFQGTVETYLSGEGKSGGFVGQAESDARFENCTADVVVNGKGTDLGGFAGKVVGFADFKGCKVKVTLTSYAGQKNRCGGFIGWNSSTQTTITDCHVLKGSVLNDKSGRVATPTTTSTTNGNYGGFIGFGDIEGTVLKITNCSAEVDVNGGSSIYNSCFISCLGYASTTTITDSYAEGDVKSFVGNYTAGLVGGTTAAAVLSITNCHYSGNITATGGYVGGIVGGCQGKVVLNTTYSEGVINAGNAYVGGLIGAAMNDGNSITNCYSTAKVSAWGQQVGGLVGTTTNRLVMTNSYASGDVYSTTSGAAGLVGRVQRSSTITNCIAWNRNVSTSRTANNVYAPGGILGCAQEAGTYSNCWRRYDMNFLDEWVFLYDQPDYINAMPPLPSYSTATHQQSYHGKAAAADATLASLAQSLGWDSNVWNFASDGSALGFTIKQLGDNKIEF